MINKFSVQNYKCYDQMSYFDLPGLTIVSGTNNSGKSSFLQAIYLLVQNKSRSYPVMTLNEELNLGSFSKILNKNASYSDGIKLNFSVDNEFLSEIDMKFLDYYYEFKSPNEYDNLTIFGIEEYPILDYLEISYCLQHETEIKNFSFKLQDISNKYLYQISSEVNDLMGYCEMPNLIPTAIIFEDTNMEKISLSSEALMKVRKVLSNLETNKIHYIKALRLQDFVLKNNSLDNQKIGLSGEFTAEIIHKKWDQYVDFALEGNKVQFKDLFNIWIRKMLGDKYSIYSKKVENDQYNIIILDSITKMELSLEQVGFGISQVLPMITMLLTSKKNDVILIENPEVHLHPKLQALFIDLCIYTLKHNRKIVIETHSEHMINRLRLNIKNNPEMLSSINIYFFEQIENGTTYSEVEIDETGRLAYWPKDFFDQSYYDLLGLMDNE